jgi:ERCC4-type nuclease
MSEIVVDSREPSTISDELEYQISHRPELSEMSVVVKTLNVGDLAFGNMIVERKTCTDLSASIVDSRIMNQLYQMSQQPFSTGAVIVSGDLTELPHAMQRACITTAADSFFRYNIPFFFVPDDYLLCYLFLKLCLKYVSDPQPFMPIKRVKPGSNDIAVRVLSTFPYIGEKRARDILTEFFSLHNVFSTDADEIAMRVMGIGKTSAQAIIDVINHKYIREK